MNSSVPASRIRAANDRAENPQASYVLYWMLAARRTRYNFALQRAAEEARRLGLPLLVVEALRLDYRWASERFHSFVIDGMVANDDALETSPASYYPYVEERKGDAKGMFAVFATHAALVVSDDAPIFFLPDAVGAAAEQCPVKMELVDGVGLYPLRATERVFTTAASFRRHLQKELPEHLFDPLAENPLAGVKLAPLKKMPPVLTERWPRTSAARLRDSKWLRLLAIDHSVGPTAVRGGALAAARVLSDFLDNKLCDFAALRSKVEADRQSHLSPYLHFGHISPHEIFRALMEREDWSPANLSERATGSRRGWWGAGESAEAFLDQLVIWRELGHNAAALAPKYRRFESLPDWARNTLEHHASDERSTMYTPEELEAAETYDPLWNAAQRQLVTEGTIHNYLRMLWGKKILEWTPDPHAALSVMVEQNNKYALDGRDPNSYSGILWVLGKYDRAWGPERPIFGKVRYMTSESTARKMDVRGYMERFGTSRQTVLIV